LYNSESKIALTKNSIERKKNTHGGKAISINNKIRVNSSIEIESQIATNRNPPGFPQYESLKIKLKLK